MRKQGNFTVFLKHAVLSLFYFSQNTIYFIICLSQFKSYIVHELSTNI